MSVITSTAQQIANNPLNKSVSKSLYSFPKTKRFNEKNQQLCDKFYNLPELKSQRKAGFGYANKYDFTKGVFKTPAPGNYEVKSEIDNQITKKIGFSIGESRSKMELFGIFNNPSKFYPGPGQYKQKSQLSDTQYSFRQRTKDPNTFTTADQTPGPGTYTQIQAIDRLGKYPISKYENSKASNFNPQQSQRFSKSNFLQLIEQYENNIPGPGTYDMKIIQLARDGSYYLSSQQNSRVRSFSQQSKQSGLGGIYENCREAGKVPGPGSYKLPSDFGHYESKTHVQQDKSRVSNESHIKK